MWDNGVAPASRLHGSLLEERKRLTGRTRTVDDIVRFVAVVIFALAIVLGLFLALISPLASHRYLTSHGYTGPALRRKWVEGTIKSELLALGIIAVGVAIGVLVFSPVDSPLRPVLLWTSLALVLMWAIAIPILEYHRLSALENPGPGLLRSWLRGTASREVSAIYLILTCLSFFLPNGSPLLRFLTSTPFILVFLTSSAIYLGIVFRNASRTRGTGT